MPPHGGSDSPKDAGSTCAHNLPAFVLDRIRFPKGHGKYLRKESPVGLVGAVPGGRCRGRTSCCRHKAAPLSADDPGVTSLVEAVNGTTLTPSWVCEGLSAAGDDEPHDIRMQRKVDLRGEACKTCRGRLNDVFIEAELDFDEKQRAARIFDDGVDFGTGRVPRVTDELPGIHAQIVDRL